MEDQQLASEVDEFVTAIEDFNRFFIRLSTRARLPFTTLSIIDTIASREAPTRVSDLAKTEQVTQPRLTQLVAQLERDGLVERHPDPRDGRAMLIRLTPEGQQLTASRHQDRVNELQPLIASLTPEEQATLTSVVPALRKLAQATEEAFFTTVD